MVYRFMIVYSNSKIEKDSEFVCVYNSQPLIQKISQNDGAEIAVTDDNKTVHVLETAITIFLNNHINDSKLKILGVFKVKNDENPKDTVFIPIYDNLDLENFE